MAGRQRVLAFAAAAQHVGYLLLEDMKGTAWGISRRASRGGADAAAWTADLIESLRPHVVITEKVMRSSKKGPRTKDVISAMTAVADRADLLNLEVARPHVHETKFEEASALAKSHPELAHLLPEERRIWDPEPRRMIYFEALALALAALGDPAVRQ